MLPFEIEPFATTHIKVIEEIREEMLTLIKSNDINESTRTSLIEWNDKLLQTSHALYRFQVCMVDETNQKARMRTIVRDCKINH